MKTSNFILKAMENLQTNVALLAAVKAYLLTELNDEEYNRISEAMADLEMPRPSLALSSFMENSEDVYNYLEKLLLTIDKPF